MNFDALARLIGSHRISLNDEKATQREIAQVLDGAAVVYERECRLPAADGRVDIPDFLVRTEGGEVAVEVKLRERRRTVEAQVARYCRQPRVKALLLLTNTAMALPATIEGKPVRVVSLGGAWLG